MTIQEIIPLLMIGSDLPPWDGEIREIQATVIVNRQPVRVRMLEVYEYWGREMVTVQALEGEPFPQTNTWYHTWTRDTHNTHIVFLQDVTLIY